jgi:hypothetical protein
MFIDFRMAYDKINQTKLWLAMNMTGFPNKLVKLARLTTEEQEISIRIHNQTSTSFS